RLEAAGLVQRQRDATDARQVRIRLTEQGQALREKARSLKHAWVGKVFGHNHHAMRDLRDRVAAFRDTLLKTEG
ncbi:winged helix DNA-binding protein, partial [Siccirubricoccus sp. KC 17139]